MWKLKFSISPTNTIGLRGARSHLKTDPETAALNENQGLLKVNTRLRYCRVYTSGVKRYSVLGLAKHPAFNFKALLCQKAGL